jgi:hypothetical protein
MPPSCVGRVAGSAAGRNPLLASMVRRVRWPCCRLLCWLPPESWHGRNAPESWRRWIGCQCCWLLCRPLPESCRWSQGQQDDYEEDGQ